MTGIETTTLLAIIGTAAGAIQAVGQITQGNAQARASSYNAQVSQNEATSARLRAAEEERRTRRDNALRLGAAAAQTGASGVAMEGSPLEVQADAAAEGELRALDARYGGLMESRFHESQAAMDRAQARSARSNARFGAIGTLIGTGLTYGRTLLGGGATLGAGSAAGNIRGSGWLTNPRAYS